MTASGAGLIGSKIAAMGLGFAFWLFAARLFAPSDVGIAAAGVAGVMLCAQISLFGLGSAFISVFPKMQEDSTSLFATTIALTAGISLLVSSLFVAWFLVVGGVLGEAFARPLVSGLFVVMGVVAGLMVLFDHISMALRRGDQAVWRSLTNGVVSLAPLGIVAIAGTAGGGMALFAMWVLGGVASIGVGLIQFRRWFAVPAMGQAYDGLLGRRLINLGVPNYLLSLATRLPAFALPILITELMSAEVNAYWYAAWMIAWATFVVPYSLSTALFAEGAHRPDSLRADVKRMLVTAILIGGLAALLAAILGPYILSLMGSEYARVGTVPLRILLLGFGPVVLLNAYHAVCRATERFAEATILGVLTALGILVAAAWVAPRWGLTGVATVFTGMTAVAGLVAGVRLRLILGESELLTRSDDVPTAVADVER